MGAAFGYAIEWDGHTLTQVHLQSRPGNNLTARFLRSRRVSSRRSAAVVRSSTGKWSRWLVTDVLTSPGCSAACASVVPALCYSTRPRPVSTRFVYSRSMTGSAR